MPAAVQSGHEAGSVRKGDEYVHMYVCVSMCTHSHLPAGVVQV
jgi:hypothetical protein